MNFIRRLWRSTIGKIVLIISGAISGVMFCCIALVIVALIAGPTPSSTQSPAVVQRATDISVAADEQPLAVLGERATDVDLTVEAHPTTAQVEVAEVTPTVAPPTYRLPPPI